MAKQISINVIANKFSWIFLAQFNIIDFIIRILLILNRLANSNPDARLRNGQRK